MAVGRSVGNHGNKSRQFCLATTSSWTAIYCWKVVINVSEQGRGAQIAFSILSPAFIFSFPTWWSHGTKIPACKNSLIFLVLRNSSLHINGPVFCQPQRDIHLSSVPNTWQHSVWGKHVSLVRVIWKNTLKKPIESEDSSENVLESRKQKRLTWVLFCSSVRPNEEGNTNLG